MGQREVGRATATKRDGPGPVIAGSVAVLLAIAAAYPDATSVPFGNDDYLMLERTARGSFLSWWGRRDLFVGWWRPWSREVHVGLLQRAFGVNEVAFHVASLVLVAGVVAALVALARRLGGARAGALAVCGATVMSAWAYPVLVAAGAQELWMILASLLAMLAWNAERRGLGTLAFAVALWSKETAALVPALFVAHDVVLARRPASAALRRAIAPLLLLAVWVTLHPHLGGRGFRHLGGAESATGVAPPPRVVAARTLGTPLSLDLALAPGSDRKSVV